MTLRQVIYSALGLSVVFMLAGCADANMQQLTQALRDIREEPGGQPRIDMPEMPDYEPLPYRHSDARSPFLAPDAVVDSTFMKPGDNSELAPDQTRAPEPLERYALQELRLVGTLQMGQRQRALIRTPENEVISVSVGNYVGSNYGRISRITEQHIKIHERVFTQRDGWQVRDVTLALADGDNADG
ncbi:pilus assembly protein PilP [Halomonas llamarensis]|uniref:Pilus assembly protein PilP n=1 Tax=Halomonas llamarensis TaxID=2945104 RepID=A0ABT0SR58_9GAMM|nr:pilus assembly protein PilP [Halomonas llamarensis]MCL7930251.1 pilus assembly protein PilP [Halomonas llamarensis]